MIFKSTNDKVPYFNAPAFLENKQKIGKVDEIFGPINEVVRLFFFACLSDLRSARLWRGLL